MKHLKEAMTFIKIWFWCGFVSGILCLYVVPFTKDYEAWMNIDFWYGVKMLYWNGFGSFASVTMCGIILSPIMVFASWADDRAERKRNLKYANHS